MTTNMLRSFAPATDDYYDMRTERLITRREVAQAYHLPVRVVERFPLDLYASLAEILPKRYQGDPVYCSPIRAVHMRTFAECRAARQARSAKRRASMWWVLCETAVWSACIVAAALWLVIVMDCLATHTVPW